MHRWILVIVWVYARQEKEKGTDRQSSAKLCIVAQASAAWAKERDQRSLVLPTAVDSLQYQMGLNSVHGVLKRFQHCSLQENWSPFNWLVTASGLLWFCFLYYFAVSQIFLCQVTCVLYMTQWSQTDQFTNPLAALQANCRYSSNDEDCCSSSVTPSWHFIFKAPMWAWSQAVFPSEVASKSSYQDQSFRKWNQV